MKKIFFIVCFFSLQLHINASDKSRSSPLLNGHHENGVATNPNVPRLTALDVSRDSSGTSISTVSGYTSLRPASRNENSSDKASLSSNGTRNGKNGTSKLNMAGVSIDPSVDVTASNFGTPVDSGRNSAVPSTDKHKSHDSDDSDAGLVTPTKKSRCCFKMARWLYLHCCWYCCCSCCCCRYRSKSGHNAESPTSITIIDPAACGSNANTPRKAPAPYAYQGGPAIGSNQPNKNGNGVAVHMASLSSNSSEEGGQ